MQQVRLSGVAEVVMGQAPAGKDCNKSGEGTPFVKVGEFGDRRPLIREWTTDPKKLAKRTDVLLCVVGATCGKINLGEDCAIGRSVAAIRPDTSKLLQHYLHYFLQGKILELRGKSQGAAQTVISKAMIRETEIPLPNTSEQQRIVAILDEAFERIDAAIANTQTNLASARELFESYLNRIFTEQGEGWVDKTMGDIADVKGGKRVPKGYKLQSEETDYPYISVRDFQSNGTINPGTVKYISNAVYDQISRYTISVNDLYISIAGTIGKSGIIPQELDGANLTENACKLVFKEGVINRFVYFYTLTNLFSEEAAKNTRVAAQPKLALERLKGICIPVPPTSTQRELVSIFDDLMGEAYQLETVYQEKLALLEELKQSILAKAFRGELTNSELAA